MFKPNLYITKIVQIVCNMCWFLVTHICYSNILQELIFVEFIGFYGILLKLKCLSFKFWNISQTSWRSIGWLTGSVVGRPDRSTDVHEMCTRTSHVGRSTARSTDWKYPTLGYCRSTGRSTDMLCPVDRAVDRRHNGQKYNRWAGRPVGRPEGHFWPFKLPTALFERL